MADKRPEDELPPLNFNPVPVRDIREVGSIEEEIKLMKEREDRAKPFPEGVLTICAMGATRLLCPFDTETWACNMGYWQIFEMNGHFQKIFLTHTQVLDMRGVSIFNWYDFNKMADSGVEIYNIHRVKKLKAKLFPLKKMIEKYKTDYYSNTIAYQLAYALYKKCYHTIHIYGCDMMTQEEYAWEKGGVEYWLGRLHQEGIKITIAEGSSLLRTITGKPYGIKYFNMKDVDPTGAIRKQLKKYAPKDTSTSVRYMSPLGPAKPEPTNWVEEGVPG